MLRRGAAHLGRVAALAALYAVAAKAAFALAAVHTVISPVWLPSGLAVAAVVLCGHRAVPAVLLGAFVFNASTGLPLWVAALIASGNALEAAGAGWLLRRTGFRRSAGRVRDVLALAVPAGLGATAAGAGVGVAALWAGGVVPAADLVSSWVLWWFGDAIGVLTLTPVLLAAWAHRHRRPRPGRGRVAEAVLLALALPVVTWPVLGAGRLTLVVPVLLWAAIRFRLVGASLASLFTSAVVIYAAARGVGPFVQPSFQGTLLTTQNYTMVLIATSMLVAAIITEREQATSALHAQQERTRSIIATARDPFFGFDGDGVVTDWNRSAETTFGWSAQEAIGRPLTGLIVPAEVYHERFRSAMTAAEDRMEVLARHRDGRELPVEVTIWSVESVGRSRFNAFARDITERKQFERDLATARDRALEASRLKSQFLATMSHEIRTPMNAVIGLAAVLLAGPLGADQRRQLQGILTAGQTLLAIINDILDLSKIEADQLVLEEADFAPGALVRDVIGLLSGTAGAKGLTLTGSCGPELPALLRGDATRIRQILLNLVDNAVKFTPHGGVTVRAGLTGVDPEGTAEVVIEVTDTGIGIPGDKQESLFDPFVQADASTTREYGGTGLGLAISRRLARAMGGDLRVSSRPGRGSTFTCTIRLAQASAAGPPADDGGTAAAPVRRSRLLLVEDNELNQMAAMEVLTLLGYHADLATNGQEAIAMAERTQYQAILMDCQMPVMDGYTATTVLRRREGKERRTPVIALTAGAFAEDRQRCLAAGMDDFIAKPFDCDELASTIARWTERPDGRAAS
ncbi:hybrid sensor histidine kinase/response regulator [Planomonospora venezuelensis]|uniref:Circadian input-output histidine kinase CikA n=1 Tax=Planomonospora venezuelensis TaxID=1999 RepID=A0A841DIY3_PLAVE|nr:MASE1 domain-containing protein [Planomonospora venezuelensis]MBB5967106.1 PAS domain S-box-containing protein [Planomonospora venezuelensis]GIN04946.1 hypothetical protein Pve01_66040 [Planomonospora venezuelensis]